MTRAEEAALKAYPECAVYNDFAMEYEDINECYRVGFETGYEQAEKDLLTKVKEYMEKGERCMQQSVKNNEQECYYFWDGFHNCAENILRELEK